MYNKLEARVDNMPSEKLTISLYNLIMHFFVEIPSTSTSSKLS